MEINSSVEPISPSTNISITDPVEYIGFLAMSHIMYKIGDEINKFYFAIMVPIGVVGNVLSFMVMIQKHNRSTSFSLYISALAVTDTITLLFVFIDYLSQVHGINITLEPSPHCAVLISFSLMTALCSILFILSMTFDRFYSIIRPHKAASFNTVKRAKITIACIVIISFIFHFPHFFTTVNLGKQCLPYEKIIDELYGEVYYWLSFVINFALPFVLLLAMNSVIIHTLRQRSTWNASRSGLGQGQGQGQGQGLNSKLKKSEKQIYITLLSITFSFLVLTTPISTFTFYTMIYDYTKSPEAFANFYFYFNLAPKLYYTNCGVNFFLYIISGQKFRTDLAKLFKCGTSITSERPAFVESTTKVTQISRVIN